MKILGIIPARLDSTRFPDKPLVDILGQTMIERVYRQASQSNLVNQWLIATPDQEILQAAESFGAKVCLTSDQHESGTDRCAEALSKQKEDYDVVINVQGDEPLINPSQIDMLASNMSENEEIATLYRGSQDETAAQKPNSVKIVTDHLDHAIYFSRLPIPYVRNPLSKQNFKLHVGMYAYQSEVLKKITTLTKCALEDQEGLEQLRWLYHGVKIKCIFTEHKNHGVDTPEDLKYIIKRLENNG